MYRSENPRPHGWRFNAAGSQNAQAIVGTFALAEASGRTLSPVVADLIEIAGAMHVVDRSVRRPGLVVGAGSWSRELHLVLGVRDLDVWTRPEVRSLLTELLAWLTDDSWSIDFTRRCAPPVAAECVQFLFPRTVEADSVALFSGGVDSVAGLAMAHCNGYRPMLMSARSNHRMTASQADVLNALRGATGGSHEQVGVDLHLDRARSIEPSQRARGFGFLSLGAGLVELCGVDTLLVFENGIGAINLPYSAAQAGSHGTRAMHPATLALASELFSAVFLRPIYVRNPNQFLTKAEMCRSLPAEVQRLLPLARSCDTAYATRLSPDSCGACTSCLLRRQALLAAGLAGVDASTDVRFDAFASTALSDPASYALRAMLSQVARLAAARASDDPWRALCAEFPDITLASAALRTTNNAEMLLMDMYSRYVSEWRALPSHLTDIYLNDGQPAA